MRFRALLTEKRSPAPQLGATYEHVLFNRALLFWLHVTLGVVIGFIYLSTLDTTHIRWWRRVGIWLLIRCIPALLPYLVSGLVTHRLASVRKLPVWAFTLVLVVSTGAVGYFYLQRTPDEGIFIAVIVQAFLYLSAARFLFGSDLDD